MSYVKAGCVGMYTVPLASEKIGRFVLPVNCYLLHQAFRYSLTSRACSREELLEVVLRFLLGLGSERYCMQWLFLAIKCLWYLKVKHHGNVWYDLLGKLFLIHHFIYPFDFC